MAERKQKEEEAKLALAGGDGASAMATEGGEGEAAAAAAPAGAPEPEPEPETSAVDMETEAAGGAIVKEFKNETGWYELVAILTHKVRTRCAHNAHMRSCPPLMLMPRGCDPPDLPAVPPS